MNDDINPKTDNENDDSALDASLPEQVETAEDGLDNNEEESRSSFLSDIISGPLLTNIILAGLFANCLMLYYNDYDQHQKFSSLLMMIQVSCIVLFFLIRVAPQKVSMDPKDWIFAILGTALPLVIIPVTPSHEIVALLLLQFVGIFISILAIISLNNSFGIVPALRKVKTSGLYSLIRHPIYFGYFIFITCLVLQNISIANICILLAIYAADIYRIIAEERILSEDPQYQAYKMRVKWRILPFVW
tara:strand:+ start:7057 stop:7794 length:738 start_codon:yes stop_codon:yes gene_type:complete